MNTNSVRVSVEVNDTQIAALSALLHGRPIDTAMRCELHMLYIHIGAQMQEHRADLAKLMRECGLAGVAG